MIIRFIDHPSGIDKKPNLQEKVWGRLGLGTKMEELSKD